MHDNMMPMSPDDYRALSQFVSSRDIAAVVSLSANQPFTITSQMQQVLMKLSLSLSEFPFSPCFQANNLIGGFDEFDSQVDAS